MKFDKKLAAILVLCLAVLVVLAYVASQGQQEQNNGIINESQVQRGNATNQTQQNATNQTRAGGQTASGNASSQTPEGNVTGGGTSGTANEPRYNQNQTPLKNLTNISDITIIVTPPDNITNQTPTNLSLYESDFMVVDDSLPSLLTSQMLLNLPPPPQG